MPLGLPAPLPEGLLQVEWCAAFSGPVRAALHALKYRGERRLAEPLGVALAERWRRAGRGGDIAVPVPVHRERRKARGFDQAEDLARVFGRHAGLPVATALVRGKRTRAQHALGKAARASNVAGVFEVPPASVALVRGRWVVLVDDITTTGATLSGCALALREAGVLGVSALTVARER